VHVRFNHAKSVASIEERYRRLGSVEKVLHRPDVYIGSVERTERTVSRRARPATILNQPMVVCDAQKMFVHRNISYVPGLYKMFDEILVNAADNKLNGMNTIKIDVDA
jgi:DNA topoisomerase-2